MLDKSINKESSDTSNINASKNFTPKSPAHQYYLYYSIFTSLFDAFYNLANMKTQFLTIATFSVITALAAPNVQERQNDVPSCEDGINGPGKTWSSCMLIEKLCYFSTKS